MQILDDTYHYMTSRFIAGGVIRGTKKAEMSKNKRKTVRGDKEAERRKDIMQKREESCPCPSLLLIIKIGVRFKSERL